MHESKEKAFYRLSVPLPKSKDGVSIDMEEDEEGEAVAAIGEQAEDDSDNTEEDTVDLPTALQREFSKLSVHQDELAHRQ